MFLITMILVDMFAGHFIKNITGDIAPLQEISLSFISMFIFYSFRNGQYYDQASSIINWM